MSSLYLSSSSPLGIYYIFLFLILALFSSSSSTNININNNNNIILPVAALDDGISGGTLNAYTIVILPETSNKIKEEISNEDRLRAAPAGAVFYISPYFVQLSSNWTVIERGVLRGDNFIEKQEEEEELFKNKEEKEYKEEGKLLHCRLPLPQTPESIKLLEKHYVKYYAREMQHNIWKFLMNSATQIDGCFFGDGEGPLTGSSEWYLFCPKGKIIKVNKTAVEIIFGNSSSLELQKKRIKKLMQRFRGNMIEHTSYRKTKNNFYKWTSFIGEYNKHITKPRWNVERRVWELIYPTNRVCNAGNSDITKEKSITEEEEEEEEEIKKNIFEGKQNKEKWETIVRLYCSPRMNDHRLRRWSITEVRQGCFYEILLESSVVCEWNNKLDNLRVNPIPCISI